MYRASDRGDKVNGGAASETVYSGKGNDTVDAGAGLDTVIFTGSRSGYTVAKTAAGFSVSGPDGVDTLANVERIKFADATVALTRTSCTASRTRAASSSTSITSTQAGSPVPTTWPRSRIRRRIRLR